MKPGARHHWAWLRAGAQTLGADADASELIGGWLTAGLPLVARARMASDPAGLQPLGLALAQPKRRLALAAHTQDITAWQPPPSLKDVLQVLPAAARQQADTLCRHARSQGLALGVYGSAAWQFFSGRSYWHEKSDLDLYVPVAGPVDAALALEWLRAADACGPLRIDGELVGPDGNAVAWREWAGSADTLLIKSVDGARLCHRRRLWSLAA
jgi:phosphoribosyl-dephospho-CoA transferase